jgi:hypothetical protein
MSPLLLSAALAALPAAEPPLQLKDGDRVVLVGGTLIEREQVYGYWEAALTARHPDKNITFRNLGWSGDTVWGESRGSFGGPAEGLKKLKEGVRGLKPTVLIVAYGGNESFAGKDGLPRFEKGLNDLLDALTPPDCRVVLLGPPLMEENAPLSKEARDAHNRDVALYRDAVKGIADKRKAVFFDLWIAILLTDNGMHLGELGYKLSTDHLERALGFDLGSRRTEITFGADGKVLKATGVKVEKLEGEGLRFRVKRDVLPLGEEGRALKIEGLPEGRYTLAIDGRAAHTADAAAWKGGLILADGLDSAQDEKLRAAIIEKNRLYFHRWRPQNETYLFGFRKHEQGQNAREVPLFDPLVEQAEKEIAKLRVPVAHVYEIKKEAGK